MQLLHGPCLAMDGIKRWLMTVIRKRCDERTQNQTYRLCVLGKRYVMLLIMVYVGGVCFRFTGDTEQIICKLGGKCFCTNLNFLRLLSFRGQPPPIWWDLDTEEPCNLELTRRTVSFSLYSSEIVGVKWNRRRENIAK